jgi:hypothetical protein
VCYPHLRARAERIAGAGAPDLAGRSGWPEGTDNMRPGMWAIITRSTLTSWTLASALLLLAPHPIYAGTNDAFALTPRPGHAVAGTATISWLREGLWGISLELRGFGSDRTYAAAMRAGSCESGGPVEMVFADGQLVPLGEVRAATQIVVPESVLLTRSHHLSIHASVDTAAEEVSCGDIRLPLAAERFAADTQYAVQHDTFWDYYQSRGAERAFGLPISRKLVVNGCDAQFFQRLIMQQCGENAPVRLLNLLDPGLMPYQRVNGSTFPGPDQALKAETPKVGDPGYATAILDFVRRAAPDDWEGAHVAFGHTFFNTVTPEMVGTDDPNLLGFFDLEIWGPPISRPMHDPANPRFIYQRFQRGIMHYDAGTGLTQGILMVDWFKSLITGEHLPADLREDGKESRYYRQYCPENPGWVCRPEQLRDSNLEWAFQRD